MLTTASVEEAIGTSIGPGHVFALAPGRLFFRVGLNAWIECAEDAASSPATD